MIFYIVNKLNFNNNLIGTSVINLTRTLVIVLFLMGVTLSGQAQDFASALERAESAYNIKQYKESGRFYEQAFRLGKATSSDYYNAACTWALAGNNDKSFQYLYQAIQRGWENISHLRQDSDLKSLHKDKRWSQLLAMLQAKLARVDATLNKELQLELAEILNDHQKYRNMAESVINRYGTGSAQADSLNALIVATDQYNVARVMSIIDHYGWPGKTLAGGMGSITAFLVIQSAEPEIQERYLPQMLAAAEQDELAPGNVAALQDRVLIRKGQKQRYGSQLVLNRNTGRQELAPLEDPERVDQRRVQVGLEPLSTFLQRNGIALEPVTE